MIDFIKCWLRCISIKELLKNPYLEFKGDFNYQTGEIGKLVAVYKNLKFIINNGRVTLTGSLHKYKNNGDHNYDDFTLDELTKVLQDLKDKFNIELKDCILENLEIGVNIIPPIICYLILNNLMFHHGIIFRDPNIKNGNYKVAEHQRYSVKIYDKSLQYENKYYLPNEILRIEIHYNKMIDLNKIGVFTLADLVSKKNLDQFLNLIITEWEKTLLFDPTINTNQLKQNIKTKKINQWNNDMFWEGLTKQARDKQKKQYFEIADNYSDKIHFQIKSLIKDKWGQLCQKDYHLTNMING